MVNYCSLINYYILSNAVIDDEGARHLRSEGRLAQTEPRGGNRHYVFVGIE